MQLAPRCRMCGGIRKRAYENLTDRLFLAQGSWSYDICTDCKMILIRQIPTPSELGDAYANYHTHVVTTRRGMRAAYETLLDAIARIRYGRRNRFVSALARLCAAVPILGAEAGRRIMFVPRPTIGSNRLLDVGCGSGALVSQMIALGWDAAGVEPDPVAAGLAATRGLPVVVGELRDQNYPASWFRIITLSHVLEHLPYPQEVLRECWRILQPGGSVIIASPNASGLTHRMFRHHWRGLEPPRHLGIFTPAALRFLFREIGASDVRVWSTAAGARYYWRESLRLARGRNGPPTAVEIALGLLTAVPYQLAVDVAIRIKIGLGDELIGVATKAAEQPVGS